MHPEQPWQPEGPELEENDQSWYPESEDDPAADTDILPSESPAAPRTARLKDAFQPPYPWLTWLLSAVCIVVWLGILSEGEITTWEQMGKWGYYPYHMILDGKVWGLLTANFFHHDFLHLFFNLFWILLLGSQIEKISGRSLLGGLVLGSCVVSSGSEILFSDQSGIGISGVVYALVGFIWMCSRHLSAYRHVLTRRDYTWLMLWLLGCVLATQAGIIHIANAAHFGGLLWGLCFAAAFVTQRNYGLARLGLGLILGVSLLPLFWMPWSVEWLEYRGVAAYQREDKQAAEAYLSRAKAKGSDSAPVHLTLGLIYDEQKRTDEALAQYQKAEALEPTYIAASMMAKIYLDQAKYADAQQMARKALSLKPGDQVMQQIIALVEMDQKRWSEAQKILKELVVDAPKDTITLNALGRCETELGNLEAAEGYYRRVLALDSHNRQAEAGLIRLLTERKQWNQARKDTLASLKRDPDSLEMLTTLGYIYLEQGDTEKSMALYTRILNMPSVAPTYLAVAHYNLACALASQNKQTEALSHLKQAIALNPTFKASALKDDAFKSYLTRAAFKALTH